jgi:hypothetical protein
MLVEAAPQNRRGLHASSLQIGVSVGALLVTSAFSLLQVFSLPHPA